MSDRTAVVSYAHASTQADRQACVGGWWSRTSAALSFICGASYLVFVFFTVPYVSCSFVCRN